MRRRSARSQLDTGAWQTIQYRLYALGISISSLLFDTALAMHDHGTLRNQYVQAAPSSYIHPDTINSLRQHYTP